MKNVIVAVFMSIVALGLSTGNAEAARLGGGKSFGMQRQAVAPRPAAPAQQAAPATQATPASAPASAPKRNWMGPIAGLAAGLGIAALLSHFGMGEGMANLLMIGLLVMAAAFLARLLLRRNASGPAPAAAMQYAGAGHSSMTPGSQSPAPVSALTLPGSAAKSIPDGFDAEAFLRVAKLNFVRLQASNDAKSIDDIREFVSPELYAEIRIQMDERGNAPQQTDIVSLTAELVEVVTESGRHVASVHFSGLAREVVGAVAAPFDELWHLTKAVNGDKGWIVAGIQQLA